MAGLFVDPAPLYSTNDPANYKRAKIFFFVVVPVMILLYFHFGDMLTPPNLSYSTIQKNHDKLVQVSQHNSKQFEVFNPMTKKLETISIARDSYDDDICSSDDLDALLLKWGVRKDYTLSPLNQKEKTDLLLIISSPSWWRMNYFLHPKSPRIKHWMVAHQQYLDQIKAIKQLNDREKMKTEFIEFINELKIHSEFEDLMLLRFLREYELIQLDVIDALRMKHDSIQQKEDHIIKRLENERENVMNADIMDLMQKYEKDVIDHFMKEEEEIVHIMLNLDNALYRKYRSLLSWKYYFIH